MTEITITDKQKYLIESQVFGEDPTKLTDKMYCIHCSKIITVDDYKVFKDRFGDEYIACPNAPMCSGTVIDWMPLRES